MILCLLCEFGPWRTVLFSSSARHGQTFHRCWCHILERRRDAWWEVWLLLTVSLAWIWSHDAREFNEMLWPDATEKKYPSYTFTILPIFFMIHDFSHAFMFTKRVISHYYNRCSSYWQGSRRKSTVLVMHTVAFQRSMLFIKCFLCKTLYFYRYGLLTDWQ